MTQRYFGPRFQNKRVFTRAAPNIRSFRHASANAWWWTKERDAKLLHIMDTYHDLAKAGRVLGIPEGQRGWMVERLRDLRRKRAASARSGKRSQYVQMCWTSADLDIIECEHYWVSEEGVSRFDACRDSRGNSWVYSAQTHKFASVANFDEANRLAKLLAAEHQKNPKTHLNNVKLGCISSSAVGLE